MPEGLTVNIAVIDNGSSDGTPQLLEWMAARHRGRIQIVEERRCGKSRALNAGIAATSGEFVGMIDDDEEVSDGWYEEVLKAFTAHPDLDFIGGPYSPVWGTPPPSWIPSDYLAVLGDMDPTAGEHPYGADFGGILKGGNAVIRRTTLRRVGPYAEYLGPAGPARLLSCEDEEMYLRLVSSGARGRYIPSLVVFHHICCEPPDAKLFPAMVLLARGITRADGPGSPDAGAIPRGRASLPLWLRGARARPCSESGGGGGS